MTFVSGPFVRALRFRHLPRAIAGAAVGLFLGWRLALWLFALLAMSVFPSTPAPTTPTNFFERTLLSGEAHWYVELSRQGYSAAIETPPLAAFPPLYPALVRLVALVVPSWTIAAALVAHAALLGAIAYLLALAGLDGEPQGALRAGIAALLWPGSALLGTISPDSLILLTVTATLYHARREQWGRAATWAALAGLTRGMGALVFFPLLITWLQHCPRRGAGTRRVHLSGLIAVAAAPLAFAGFLAFLWWQLGSPFAFFRAQGLLGAGSLCHPLGLITLADWKAIAAGTAPLVRGYPTDPFFYRATFIPAIVDAGPLLIGAAAGFWLAWRRRWSEGVFVLVGTATVCAIWGLPDSAHHLLPFVPIYVALSGWTARPTAGYLVALLGLELLALSSWLYLNLLPRS